jgi:hypothetical protein
MNLKNSLIALCLVLQFPLVSKAQLSQPESLALLCKSWGLLNYYHPKTQVKSIDWNKELNTSIAAMLRDSAPQSLSEILSAWRAKLGDVKPLKKPFARLPKDTLLNNLNFSWIDVSILPEKQKAWLWNTVRYYRPFRHKTYFFNKKDERNAGRAYFHDSTSEMYYLHPIYPGKARALTAMFRFWNHVQYLYPYKKGLSWDSVLNAYIPLALKNSGTPEIFNTIAAFIHEVRDSHADFMNPVNYYSFGNFSLPLRFKYVEGQTIVTYVNPLFSKDFGLHYGDVLLEKNCRNAQVFRDSISPLFRASNDLATQRDINYELTEVFYLPYSSFINLNTPYSSYTIKSNSGSIKTVDFVFDTLSADLKNKIYDQSKYSMPKANFNDSDYTTFDGNIGYINLADARRLKELNHSIRSLKGTKALILDIRNYPLIGGYNFPHFFSGTANRFARFYIPRLNHFPGTFRTKTVIPNWSWLFPFAPRYKGKLIILCDEHTQSAAEFSIMAMKANTNAIVIGRNTAGADGNIVDFKIDDNMFVTITGLGVCYPDGRPTQRIGIVPDIYVKEDLQAVKDGRDAELERALHYAREGK